MKRWLARCLAGTLGCGVLSVLALLLAALLSAGGDLHGAQVVRIAAIVLAAATAAGLSALVVLLSIASLQPSTSPAPPPTEARPS